MSEENERLKSEADFQNLRTEGKLERFETRRRKFYFLTQSANQYFQKILDENTSGKEIIVVGCAEGGVTPLARKGAKKVIGVDIASEPILRLNKAIEDSELSYVASAVVGNAESLEMEENTADVICCLGVLHHLDVEKAADSWSKTLNRNGMVVMEEPMALNPAVALYRLLTPGMRTSDEHPLLPKDIRILRKYFDVVEVRGYVLFSLLSLIFVYLFKSDSLRDKSNQILEKIDGALLSWFGFLNYFCWTSVIVLKAPKKN